MPHSDLNPYLSSPCWFKQQKVFHTRVSMHRLKTHAHLKTVGSSSLDGGTCSSSTPASSSLPFSPLPASLGNSLNASSGTLSLVHTNTHTYSLSRAHVHVHSYRRIPAEKRAVTSWARTGRARQLVRFLFPIQSWAAAESSNYKIGLQGKNRLPQHHRQPQTGRHRPFYSGDCGFYLWSFPLDTGGAHRLAEINKVYRR